jgi:hypothetical protein
MRISPCMLLVCLLFSMLAFAGAAFSNQDYIDVIIDNSNNLAQPLGSLGEAPVLMPAAAEFPSLEQIRSGAKSSAPVKYSASRPVKYQANYPTNYPVKCKAPSCEPSGQCYSPQSCAPGGPPCILPKRGWRQMEFWMDVFWSRMSGVARFPGAVANFPTTDVDPNSELGIPTHNVLLEYGAYCQFRPQWALYYSIMPISLEGNETLLRTVYLGNLILGPGTFVHTKWDFVYQKAGLLYEPIKTCNTVISLRGSWTFNEQRYQINSAICTGRCVTVDRTRQMASLGVGLQKCLKTMCNGGTLGCDSKVDLGFLDNTFALDVKAGLRYAVPMGANRFGYASGGYRLLQLQENRNDLRLDATFEGFYAEGGIVF